MNIAARRGGLDALVQRPHRVRIEQHVLVHLHVVGRRALVEHALEGGVHRSATWNAQALREAAVLRPQMRHARGEGGSADGGHEHRHGVAQIHRFRRRVVAAKHALPPSKPLRFLRRPRAACKAVFSAPGRRAIPGGGEDRWPHSSLARGPETR